MNSIDKIDRYVARLLMVSFFLSARLQIFIAGGACIYFVARTVVAKQWAPRSNYIWALFFSSIFLIYLLAVPFTPPQYRKELLHICERLEALMLMPVAFAIISPQFIAVIMDELIFFVYGCFISCMLSNADFVYHYIRNDSGTHPLSHVLYRIYFEAISGIHPTYMSMYLCFSVCILLASSVFTGRRGTIIKYTLLYSMVVLLLSLLAKSPLIAMVLILVHASWVNRKTLYKYKAMMLGGVGISVVTAFAVPFFRQRMWEIVQFLGIGTPATSATNSFSDRTMVFSTDMAMLRHYWLTGVGPGRLLTHLHARYFFHSITAQRYVGYFDPHSQYFAVWLSFGILGLLLFLVILVTQFVKAIRAKSYLYLYLLIILSVTFFTESVLYRQQGVVFYSVFTCMFFFTILSHNRTVSGNAVLEDRNTMS